MLKLPALQLCDVLLIKCEGCHSLQRDIQEMREACGKKAGQEISCKILSTFAAAPLSLVAEFEKAKTVFLNREAVPLATP
jgi:hypothetical protein